MSKRILIALLIVFVVSPALADPPQVLRPKPHEGYEVKDNRIFFRKGNAGIILEVANQQSIEKYYSERGSKIGNPLTKLGDEVQNATVFMVTLLNRTNGSLTFTPRYVIARIKTEAYFPLDYLILLENLEGQESHTKDMLQQSIFHSPELLHPGKVVTKFLIFPGLPKKFNEIRLQFDYLYFENNEIKSDFFFTTK